MRSRCSATSRFAISTAPATAAAPAPPLQLRQEHQRNAHGLDATYLRAILVQGLTTGVIPPSTTLLPVLAEVLRLSQEEEDRIQVIGGARMRLCLSESRTVCR